MTTPPSTSSARSSAALRIVTAGASVGAMLVGCLVLLGWWRDLEGLKRLLPGLVAMNPTTAVAFILAGSALHQLRTGPVASRAGRVGWACAALVALVGLLKLGGIVLGADLGLDQLLFQEKLDADATQLPNRMAPNTALGFLLVGSALILLGGTHRRRLWFAQVLALGATLLSLLAILGYAYHIPAFYGLGAFIPMALHTALTFLVLAVGILCARPNHGFMAIVTSDSMGGVLARRLLPCVLLIPAGLGWVRLEGQRSGLFGTEQGAWLLVGGITITFVGLVGWNAYLLFRSDTTRKAIEDDLRRLNAHLARRQRELEELTVALQAQGQRLEQHAATLVEVNRALAQKNDENEMFVYSVSHDLRSPLVNLEGFSQELAMISQDLRALLVEDVVPPALRQRGLALVDEEMAGAIRFIQTAVARLSTIIDALLRLSRAGRVEFQWQEVATQTIVGRIVAALHDTITTRGARVTVGPLPPAWGDPTAVEQIFANLLENALRYLDPQRPGRIEVGSVPAADGPGAAAAGHTYYVRDNGVGIPAHATTKIFQIFQRAHPQVAPGEGLGLALVHRLVERHGGRIWVESTEGVGSTFFVTLPAPPLADRAQGGNHDVSHAARDLVGRR